MLQLTQYNRPLYFPRLKHIGETSFTSWGSKQGKTSIFILDWSKKEQKVQQKHAEWMEQYHSDKRIPFIPSLPRKWKKHLETLKFAIPMHYLDEIRRTTYQTLLEWNRKLPFDASIREACLQTAEAFIDVAFILIADCRYDEKTDYFSRADNKFLTAYLMRYCFWCHQARRGLLWRQSKLDTFEQSQWCRDERQKSIAVGFLEDMRMHQRALDETYDVLMRDEEHKVTFKEEK